MMVRRLSGVKADRRGVPSRCEPSTGRTGCKPVALLVLPALLVLAVLLAAGQPAAGAVAPASVGDYAAYFPGERPDYPIDPSGYIQVPYSAALNPTGSEITIEAWVKRDASDRYETIVGNGHATGYWLGFHDSGKLRFSPAGILTSGVGNSVVRAGVWTHVAVTYDGTTRRFYINGVLDRITSLNPGPLKPAPAGQPMGIGFDRDDYFTPNYFGGWIDNVRIWDEVRDASEIRAGMFQSFGAARPHLLAEWSLDGDADDDAGGHDGILVGAVNFGNEGAIPHDIRIPQLSVTANLDGLCSSSEYANATRVTVDNTEVRLMHTADDLWICFDDLTDSASSALVYLDPQYTRLDPAQPEHLLLWVKDDYSTAAEAGSGLGGWESTTVADGKWAGAYRVHGTEFLSYIAEFRISDELLDGWGHVIGLALSKWPEYFVPGHTIIPLWPALAKSGLPSTWSRATLGSISPPRTFSGQVVYQPRDGQSSPVGIPGVEVELIGSDPGGSEALAATVESTLDGSFSLTTDDDYTEHRLELGTPPRGYVVKQASAGPPGVAVDPRTLDFGPAPPGTYANNTFTLGDALPYPADTKTGPYFLIVAPQLIIDSGALDEFRDFKVRQGFAVGIESVEWIEVTYPGSDLIDKIRALEQERLNDYGDRFQYLMLVGPHSVIPFAHFCILFNGENGDGEIDLDACLAGGTNPSINSLGVLRRFTDWPYADLVSDFDSNRNGCRLDGILPDRKHPWVEGYQGDQKPRFEATVAVGRIPFSTPGAVRTALRNSMRFEQQSQAFKQQVLHAMSFIYLQGYYWSTPDQTDGDRWLPCPCEQDDWEYSHNCSDFTDDASCVTEDMRRDYLDGQGYHSTTLYEDPKPPVACPETSPQLLTEANLVAALQAQDFGLVDLSGHGSYPGLGRRIWTDLNGNNRVDSPTEPLAPNHKSGDEISKAVLLRTSNLQSMTPDNGHGAVYVVDSCRTGDPFHEDSFGAMLVEGGHGVAWIGQLSSVGSNVRYLVVHKLLARHLRVGDAVWQTLEANMNQPDYGTGDIATDLFGDPTLSYWGNPGGQSTAAAWPMLRHDGQGQSYSTLAGPGLPKELWTYDAYAPLTVNPPPSPVVSNNGEVIVAHGSYVDVLRGGELYQRLTLDANAYGTPALAADGTIYALDANGRLYAFRYTGCFGYLCWVGDTPLTGERARRWALDLGSAPTTSPVVGADGFIAVGRSEAIVLVRQDGVKFREFAVPGQPVGAPTVGADRAVYVATKQSGDALHAGYLVRLDFFLSSEFDLAYKSERSSIFEYTPPLLAYGFLYLGQGDGKVLKLTTGGLVEKGSFSVDGEIVAGPIAGPGQQILVGTDQGTLYSLDKDLNLNWQRSLGAAPHSVPAFSADALYIVNNNQLQAYHPYSGAPLWQRDLDYTAQRGSVAVGYGRELYVQMGDHYLWPEGKVMAFGEGWSLAPYMAGAWAAVADDDTIGIDVEWVLEAAPVSVQGSDAQPAAPRPQDTSIGILLQRSSGDGEWEDVAILPPGTTEYFDDDVLQDTAYAYRVQVLDSEGNDSDFTTIMVETQSLPPLPSPPTLDQVTVEGAEALGLAWSSPPGDVVTDYRVERRQPPETTWTPALQTSGQVSDAVDDGLSPGTTYDYRVTAVNGAGESNPSNVLSGTTRQRTLPAPEDVTAALLDDGRIQIDWNPGPEGASTEIEYMEGPMDRFEPLATTGRSGPYSIMSGEPAMYLFRLKFVLGDAESAYTEAPAVVIMRTWYRFLPVILRQGG